MKDEERQIIMKEKNVIENHLSVKNMSETERRRWLGMVEWMNDLLIANDPQAVKDQEDEEAKGV